MTLSFIDVVMAGHHSALTLSAVSVGTNVLMPIVVIALGLLLGMNPLCAAYSARGDHARIAGLLVSGSQLAVLFALVAWAVLQHPFWLLDWLDLPDDMYRHSTSYLRAVSWGTLPLFVFLAFRFLNEGLFANRQIMLISLSALPVNVAANFWLVFVKDLGAEGLGYGTAISYGYMCLLVVWYTLRTKRYRSIQRSLAWFQRGSEHVRDILRLGLPIAASLGMEVTLFAGIGLLIAQYGVSAVSGHHIALNVSSMTFMVPLGISTAATARVGYFYGKHDLQMTRRVGLLAVVLSALVMTIFATMMWTIPETVVSMYTDDVTVTQLAVQLLAIAALFQLFDGIQVTLAGVLRGLQDTLVPMLVSFIAYWLVGFGLGHHWSATYGPRGYWMGLVAGLGTAAVLLSLRFASHARRDSSRRGCNREPDDPTCP
jgi:MATE family multidrug resistance protein